LGGYLRAKTLMKNYKEFLGWSGFVIGICGIALILLGDSGNSEPIQWLGVIVGAIGCVFLVYYSITKHDEPKKIVHNLYSKEEWDEQLKKETQRFVAKEIYKDITKSKF